MESIGPVLDKISTIIGALGVLLHASLTEIRQSEKTPYTVVFNAISYGLQISVIPPSAYLMLGGIKASYLSHLQGSNVFITAIGAGGLAFGIIYAHRSFPTNK